MRHLFHLSVFVAATALCLTGQAAQPAQHTAYLDSGVKLLADSGKVRESLQQGHNRLSNKNVILAADGRVLVEVRSLPEDRDALHQQLLTHGVRFPEAAPVRPGVLPVWLLPSEIHAIASIPQVRAMTLPPRHITNDSTSKIPAEAAAPLKFTTLPTGISGQGITVGVISSSFNYLGGEATDVAADNLPGTGNPAGNTTPVVIVADATTESDDEGRAMAQIIHSLLPKAKLCFSTPGDTDDSFVAAISNLQDSAHGCGANIIVDDESFYDDPMFSDGAIGREVDTVAGKGVVYASSAGNSGEGLLDATFTPISDSAARSGTGTGGISLASVPTDLTAGGFHNFGTASSPNIFLPIEDLYGSYVDGELQWDDPFVAGKVTQSYNVLFFSTTGSYQDCVCDDAISTGAPYQSFQMYGELYVAISAAQVGTATTAKHLRMIGYQTAIANEAAGVPSIQGHPASANALGVAAYPYSPSYYLSASQGTTPTSGPEFFSAYGPTTIDFDDSGNRLTTPVTRKKPDVAGVDGLDTSFFGGGDNDSDGLENFYGTSAAAPTIASVAGAIMQASGGPGKLTPAQIRQAVIASTGSTVFNPQSGYGLANVSTAVSAVQATTSVAVSASPNPAVVGQSVTLTAQVTRSNSLPYSGIVTFSSGSITIGTAAPNSSGVAKLTAATTGLAAGNYPVSASYGGDATAKTSTSPAITVKLTAPVATTTRLTANPASVTRPANITLTATVTSSSGTPAGSVTFSTGTVTLATVNLTNGTAVLTGSTGSYAAGTYPVIATYNGSATDAKSASSSVTVTLR